MNINIRWKNKRQNIVYPNFFKEQGYEICVSKKQFDYFNEIDIAKDRCFFDYKKKIIYIHEWFEADCTGDCDYAWNCAGDRFIRVFKGN